MADRYDIQRYPKGLIDILGMTATGETPHKLSDEIKGCLNLEPYYLLDRMQVYKANSAIAPVGIGAVSFLSSTVPSNQMWLVYGYALRVPATAAATALNLTMVMARGTLGIYQAMSPRISLGASEGTLVGESYPVPLIARPGDSFAIYVSGIIGAPATTPELNLAYVPVTV